ncbi:MAG: hypothetical protein PHP60_08225, partial [Bacteroidales bacterium]|nr:hypothetical protein [Bacteroidales bacterium]
MKRFLLFFVATAFVFSCSTGNKQEKAKAEFEKVSQKVKQEFAPDRREKTFEPRLVTDVESGPFVLKGSVCDSQAKDALVSALSESGIEVLDSMIVLPDPALGDKTYGITSQSVINFRYGPGYSTESATQTLMGMPLRILEKRGNWTRA